MTLQELDLTARKAAQHYQGAFALPTVLMGLGTFAAFLATPFAVVNGTLPLWLGCLLIALLTYMAYTVLHEAVHGSISGSHPSLRWVNECMGYGAAFILMIPLTAHRHEHLTHHRHTNNADEDPDFVVSDMAQSPFHALRAAWRMFSGQYRHYLRCRWPHGNRKQNRQFVTEVAIAVAARAAFLAQGYWLEGMAMILIGAAGGTALLLYLFAYLVHRPHGAQGRYVDTSTIIAPAWCNGPITWCWLFQNYHAIHHLFPRIPFYHYHNLFEEIEPTMRAHQAPIYRLTLSGLELTRVTPNSQGLNAGTPVT